MKFPMAIDQAYTAATPDPIAGFGPAVAGFGAQGRKKLRAPAKMVISPSKIVISQQKWWYMVL